MIINGLEVVNVRKYGAHGNGVVDDTAAIQAAITAVRENGILLVPTGRYKITTLTCPKSIYIKGTGAAPWSAVADVFGHVGWGTSNDDIAHGAVFECAAASGVALDFQGDTYVPRVVLENFTVRGIGDNTRTTTGIKVGSGARAARVRVVDVSVFNFATGWDLTNCQECVLHAPQARGCTVGFNFGLNSNANAVHGLTLHACVTGVLLDSAAQCRFEGGAIQGCTSHGVRILGGGEHSIDGLYFEGLGGHAISVEKSGGSGTGTGGDNNRVRSCHFGTVNDGIEVWTAGNDFDLTGATEDIDLKASTVRNTVRCYDATLVTDAGAHNFVFATNNEGHTIYFTPDATQDAIANLGLYGGKVGFRARTEDGLDLLLESRDDLGYHRLYDAQHGFTYLLLRPHVTASERYVYSPVDILAPTVPLYRDGGTGSKNNTTAHAQFSGGANADPAVAGDAWGYEAHFKVVAAPGDVARVRLMFQTFASDLVDGVELFYFDVSDSGHFIVRGVVTAEAVGTLVGGGLVTHEATIQTGGAIGAGLIPTSELDIPADTSTYTKFGFTFISPGTWGGGSTITMRRFKTRRLSARAM